ncbi:MAG TPA: Spx/MgsR family RNA polymerase-binding regulatory protein, partial [Woeseiaceae bacterium]|nr:Spx/MgsR family RNA polymerase-binding regulatory protein [Woeseiaceae bacterium]
VYGIGSCDACRAARRWLDDRGIAYRFHDLRADGLDVQTLERWAGRIDWEKLLNTQSITFRRLPEVDRSDMTWSRAIVAMLDHPTLVKRPVIEHPRFLAVGFSPERYAEIFAR